MREAILALSMAERHLLSEISVNPILKQVIALSRDQIELDLLNLTSDSENFKHEYERLQMMRFFYIDLQNSLDELFNEFYKPQQTLGDEK